MNASLGNGTSALSMWNRRERSRSPATREHEVGRARRRHRAHSTCAAIRTSAPGQPVLGVADADSTSIRDCSFRPRWLTSRTSLVRDTLEFPHRPTRPPRDTTRLTTLSSENGEPRVRRRNRPCPARRHVLCLTHPPLTTAHLTITHPHFSRRLRPIRRPWRRQPPGSFSIHPTAHIRGRR